MNNRSDKIGAKIRQAELEKINVMLIIGEKEVEENKISVRRRFEGNTGTIGIDELKLELIKEIKLGVYHIGKKPQQRLNEDITSKEVRLISDSGEQLGVVPIEVAIDKAKEVGLDLIEVAPLTVSHLYVEF